MKTDTKFFIKYRSVLLRMRNVLDKRCKGKQSTHFMFNNFSFIFRKIVPFMW